MPAVSDEANGTGPQPDGGAGSSTAAPGIVDIKVAAVEEEGERISTAIKDFMPPDGYEVLPTPARSSSRIYSFGVKMKHKTTSKWSFACFGSPSCRVQTGKGIFIAISPKASSNATEHINAKHKAGASTKTVAAKAKTDGVDLRVLKAVSSVMYAQDQPRFLAMTFVKTHVIEGFCPLSHGEKEWVRTHLKLTAVKNFPFSGIHNKAVKHMVTEMYAATASQFKKEMAAEVGGMPLLHLNLDLWVDTFSSLKYIGIRLFYIDRTWVLRSRLIAVRQFNPTKELLESNRLSGLLEEYLKSVLEEYGLDTTLLFSATSDAGSDVKRLCKVLLPGLWEWCVCHMINCALVEALGTHVDPAKSKNPAARQVIMTVKKVVEHTRKSSPRAKAIFEDAQVRQYAQCSHRKLVNAAPQRWSGVSNVLEAIIVNRATIDDVYTAANKKSPLTSVSAEIDELYSIIKPAAQVIVTCQQTHVPTGQAAVLAMAALKLTTLNADAPLDILTPARKLAQGGTDGIGGGERPASSVPREHGSLTAVARDTRKHLLEAVGWRWFDKRYKDGAGEDTDYVFDMQMALHPHSADLAYVKKLAPTSQRAAAVKSIIVEKIISLAVELAEAAAAAKEDGSTAPAESSADQPAAKRARQEAAPASVHPIFKAPFNKKQQATSNLYASLGLFGSGGGGAGEEPPSLEETARAELTKLRAVSTLTAELSCEDVLLWWKRWAASYPLLARVARVVFGAPASAAVLERDFTDAGRMTTSSRSTMDSKYVEMILFLHGNLDLIPQDIPKLTEAAAQTKIPGRLVNLVEGLEELDGAFSPVDLTDGEEASGEEV